MPVNFLFNHLPKLGLAAVAIQERALAKAALEGQWITRQSFIDSPPDLSKTYFSSRTRLLRNPSFVDNPPRVDSGELSEGIKVSRKNSHAYAIQSTAPHALIEIGKGVGGIDKARPYMLPMAFELKKKFPQFFVEAYVKGGFIGRL